MANARRVVLLGLSGADWSLLRPLFAGEHLPTLAALVQRAANGRIRSLQPQFEPLLWTSVTTGRRADAHRVLDAVVPGHDRGWEPLSALTRRAPALWNLCADADRKSLVINWPVTFPAEPAAGCCVSDAFFRLAGDPSGLLKPPETTVSPHALYSDLLDLRMSPIQFDREELAYFMQAAGVSDPMMARLAVRLAEQASVHGVSMELINRIDWQLMMVRYDLLNALGPECMACHPPQLPWVPDSTFARCQNAITHAAIYLDHQIGCLLKTLPDDVGVIIFSERGLLTNAQRPASAEAASRKAGQPWYGDHGVILMAGPGITEGADIQGAGLLDLAPTVLHWLGLDLPDGLEGRVLAEAFDAPVQPRLSGRPAPSLDRCGGHPLSRQLSPEERAWLVNRWRETGIDPATDERARSALEIEHDRQFILAMVLLDADRPNKARPVLENLLDRRPDDERVQLHLARCRQACGDLAGARELLEEVVDHSQVRPYELMALARLYHGEGRLDEALACLFRAEQAESERPTVHCRIGEVYLDLQRPEEAERGFSKALERHRDHGPAHIGMARLRLAAGEVDSAVDHALRAVEENRESTLAHYWLARALVAADKPEEARIAYAAILGLRPGHVPARRELADVLEELGQHDEAARERIRADKLEMQERARRSTRDLLGRASTP